MEIKEKLSQSLGIFGFVLYFIFYAVFKFAPLIVLGLPFIVDLILIAIILAVPILNTVANIVVWVWGLITIINGPQDTLAIIYYILFGVWAIYTAVTLISSFKNK